MGQNLLRLKTTSVAKPPPLKALDVFNKLQQAAQKGETRQTSALLKQLRPHLRIEALTRKGSKDATPLKEASEQLSGIPHAALTALLNTLLQQCTSKEAVLTMFNDLIRDGVRPDVYTYTIVMKSLLSAPAKWDDIKTVLSIRQKMVDAGMQDNAETVGVLLALAALQTPIRHEKYMELWRLVKERSITLHAEDYVYFFDMPPARKYESFIMEVVEDMRQRPDISEERWKRYLSKWKDLCQKYADADFELGIEDEEEPADTSPRNDNVPTL